MLVKKRIRNFQSLASLSAYEIVCQETKTRFYICLYLQLYLKLPRCGSSQFSLKHWHQQDRVHIYIFAWDCDHWVCGNSLSMSGWCSAIQLNIDLFIIQFSLFISSPSYLSLSIIIQKYFLIVFMLLKCFFNMSTTVCLVLKFCPVLWNFLIVIITPDTLFKIVCLQSL